MRVDRRAIQFPVRRLAQEHIFRVRCDRAAGPLRLAARRLGSPALRRPQHTAPGSIAWPWLIASIIWPSISTAPLGSIFERATPTRPIRVRRGSSGTTSSLRGSSPRNAFPMRVFGQYLNATATSAGTANTVIVANIRPVAGPGGRPFPGRNQDRRNESDGCQNADNAAGRNKNLQHHQRSPRGAGRIAQAISGITISGRTGFSLSRIF